MLLCVVAKASSAGPSMLRALARVRRASRAGRWASPSGRGWPLPGGARAGRVLRLHTRGCPSLPSRCAVLSLRECQNRPDRSLQHQPAHLSLLLSPGWQSGLLLRGRLPHPAALGSAQPGPGRRHGGGFHPAGDGTTGGHPLPSLRRRRSVA